MKSLAFASILAVLAPQTKETDYGAAMAKVAARFKGKEGVVLHIGDSITYANPYSSWAKGGQGKTPQDEAVCKWMHVGAGDDTDGVFLCSVDRPGGRSETAVSGIKSFEFLEGGKAGIPPLAEVVKKYNPQMVVVMLGTNDLTAGRAPAQYKADMAKVIDVFLANGSIAILSTLPPCKGKDDVVKSYNAILQELAKEKQLPLIDFGGEILKRRPTDWLGTLVSSDGVHPTAGVNGAAANSAPTEENLKNSGYLLRGWLSVRKIAEVKERVLDRAKKK